MSKSVHLCTEVTMLEMNLTKFVCNKLANVNIRTIVQLCFIKTLSEITRKSSTTANSADGVQYAPVCVGLWLLCPPSANVLAKPLENLENRRSNMKISVVLTVVADAGMCSVVRS